MTDTQYLRFSLKENATIFTKKLDLSSSNNGQVLKFVANPLASMLKKTGTASSAMSWKTNTLGITISRWREIKYIGTQVAFKPLATNGSVDPAHIQQTATTNPTAAAVQGAINPYDSNNHIHWRRWLGGNLNIPTLSIDSPTDAMRLDNYWLQDDRFNHANVNQGFETFIAPLRAKLTAGAMMSQGLFGYYNSASIFTGTGGDSLGQGTGDRRSNTAIMGSLDEVEEQGWLPNPMAGLKYSFGTETEPGYEGDFDNVEIKGINTKFPWYGDVLDTSGITGLTTDVICTLIKERFMAPMLIVRIPAAYSTVYGWRVYISHNFAVRKPFMTASAWEVSQILEQTAIPIIRATVKGASNDDKREYCMEERPIEIIQALQVDPYADTEYPNTISMASNMKYLGSMWGMAEPRSCATETKPQQSPTAVQHAEDEEGMIPHN